MKLSKDYIIEGYIFKKNSELIINEMAVDPLIARIRQDLKRELGYNARQVSVSQSRGGYSSKIGFTIRDPKISKKEIEDFADKYEDIDYDEFNGEILSGGNTFVDVRYSDQVEDILTKKYLDALYSVKDEIDNNNGVLVSVPGTNFKVGFVGGEYTLFKNRLGKGSSYNIDYLPDRMISVGED